MGEGKEVGYSGAKMGNVGGECRWYNEVFWPGVCLLILIFFSKLLVRTKVGKLAALQTHFKRMVRPMGMRPSFGYCANTLQATEATSENCWICLGL